MILFGVFPSDIDGGSSVEVLFCVEIMFSPSLSATSHQEIVPCAEVRAGFRVETIGSSYEKRDQVYLHENRLRVMFDLIDQMLLLLAYDF